MSRRTHGPMQRRRGITLVEVMIAIAILLVMSAIVVESLRNSIEFHNLLSDRDSTVRTARVALTKIKRDLQLAYLTPNRNVPDRFLTVFVGLDEEPDRLFFASLNHQRLYLNSRESDMTEISIWAEGNPNGPGFVLYHRESAIIDGEPDEDGIVWPLAYNVRSFSVRYLDQASEEWQEEWDSRGADTPYRLPRAIEIGLVLIAPDPDDPTRERTVDVPFLAQVTLDYAHRMPNPNIPGSNNLTGMGGVGGAGANGLVSGFPGIPGMPGGQVPGMPPGGVQPPGGPRPPTGLGGLPTGGFPGGRPPGGAGIGGFGRPPGGAPIGGGR